MDPNSQEARSLRSQLENTKRQIESDYEAYSNLISRTTKSGENKINMFAMNPTTGQVGGYVSASGSLFNPNHNRGAVDFNAGPDGNFYSPFSGTGTITKGEMHPGTFRSVEDNGNESQLVRGIYSDGNTVYYFKPVRDENGRKVPKMTTDANGNQIPVRVNGVIQYKPDLLTVYTPSTDAERIRLETERKNGNLSSHGNSVRIQSPDGTNMIIMHLRNQLNTNNSQIQKGQALGRIGTTGLSKGIHGHIEISVPSNQLTQQERNNERIAIQEDNSDRYRVDMTYYLNHIEGRRKFRQILNGGN
jgi:hypothetical protein